MGIRDQRAIGAKKPKPSCQQPQYDPTPEEIAREAAIIRAENEKKRQGKKPQPIVDDDCDPELEELADQAARRMGE